MALPPIVIAVLYSGLALLCLYDLAKVPTLSIKAFRFFEAITCGFVSFYYWDAWYRSSLIPSADLRYVWLALGIVIGSEIISRQSWGTRRKP
jgi:hypothetical protein